MNRLKRECRVFCQYLFNKEPSNYVVQKYIEAHEPANLNLSNWVNPREELLLKISTWNRFFTRLIDSYTVIFWKTSLIRKKLILLVAIIESSDQAHQQVEGINNTNKPLILLRIAARLVTFIFILSLSLIIIFPITRVTYSKM